MYFLIILKRVMTLHSVKVLKSYYLNERFIDIPKLTETTSMITAVCYQWPNN